MEKVKAMHDRIGETTNFIGQYFKKTFHEELSVANQEDIFTPLEIRDNLKRMLAFAKSKKMPQSLISSLLHELIMNGPKVGIYEEQVFREYMQNTMYDMGGQVIEKHRKAQNTYEWNSYIANVQCEDAKHGSYHSTQAKFVKDYLQHFCKQAGNLKAFKDIFDAHVLKEAEEHVAVVHHGKDLADVDMPQHKYEDLQKQVMLNFPPTNRELFKVDEEVELKLIVKNVQTLYIKIFEFNTETYYKKKLAPFNTSLNLDGLVAAEEETRTFDKPALIKFEETFKFPSLKGRVGLFIIEFIGNGINARAIIKKGSLSLLHKPTVAGHLAYVLDENKKICNGPQTGIHFEGQYYEAQQEKNGRIFIPYGSSVQANKCVLMNDGFAMLGSFTRLTEQYSLKVAMALNHEEVLLGQKASVMIRPSLFINGRAASLELLKNSKVTLTTLNFTDKVPVTKTFENLTVQNNKEVIVDFQVPPYLQNISVTFSCDVKSLTKQSTESFSEHQDFSIETHESDLKNKDFYLRKEGAHDYTVYCLGKNGEPKANQEVNVQLISVYGGRSTSTQLFSDKEGRVFVKNCKNYVDLNVSAQEYNSRRWVLNKYSTQVTYPTDVDILEDEGVSFPI
jgi:hypothetical protein